MYSPRVASAAAATAAAPAQVDAKSDASDIAARARQNWCLEVGIPIGPPPTVVAPAPGQAAAARAAAAVVAGPAAGAAPAAAAAPDAAAAAAPVEEAQQVERVFGSIDDLLSFLQACIACRLRNLFFKWTMSEKVTPSVWRGFVDQVRRSTEGCQSKSAPLM